MLEALQKGDLIYICSPAKAIEAEHVQFAKNFLVENGYRVEVSKHATGNCNYFSGTIEERVEDFQKGLDHPEAKVVLCTRGGYGCMQLMEKLDWNSFENNPKLIVGFSDVTTFHMHLNGINVPSVHGTMPLNFKDNSPESLRSLLNVFTGKPEVLTAANIDFNRQGTARGKVLGGNMAMVHSLLPSLRPNHFEGNILFLEDVGEHLYKIDRMFYGLRYAGVLDQISGLMLGGFSGMSDTDTPFGKALEEIILSHVAHRQIPVGFGFPCGHQPDNQALVLGGSSILEVNNSGSSLMQSYLESLS